MMSRCSVSVLTTFAVSACVAAILTADPERAAATAAVAPTPTDTALDARGYHIAARIACKNALVDELIAGRATLAQVSDEFLRMNEEEPAILLILRHRYPGSGDEERSAHNVIGYVRVRYLPAAAEARVLDRLGREFADRFGHPPDGEP